jgi:hypothetical protein
MFLKNVSNACAGHDGAKFFGRKAEDFRIRDVGVVQWSGVVDVQVDGGAQSFHGSMPIDALSAGMSSLSVCPC